MEETPNMVIIKVPDGSLGPEEILLFKFPI